VPAGQAKTRLNHIHAPPLPGRPLAGSPTSAHDPPRSCNHAGLGRQHVRVFLGSMALGISLALRLRDADRPGSVKPSPIASASWRFGAVAGRATERPETWVEQSSACAEFRAVCRLP
jgi:hypothetical protein